MIQPAKYRGTISRYSPVFLLLLLVTVISFFTRVALLIKTGQHFQWNFLNVSGAFFIGLFFDLAVCTYLVLPFVLQIWLTNELMYKRRVKWISIGLYLVLLYVLLFTKLVPADFNADLKTGITWYVVLRFAIFLALAFTNVGFRKKWRVGVLYVDFFLVVFLLLLNAVSEYFFWDEFSVRYNFIAVDYLVYTNEVLGNIKESYPIGLIVSILAVLSFVILFVIHKLIKRSVYAPAPFRFRTVVALVFFASAVFTWYVVKSDWKNFSTNEYANELAGNGMYQFGHAFWNNELDFFKFYATIPTSEAFAIVRQELQSANSAFVSDDSLSIERQVTYAQPENRYNVVLISVESFSADFMQAFGSTKNITPYLDSLAQHSLLFTNLYASGTRTVRGLEALSLALPPSPGQSIVKRPNNEHLFSLGSIFQSKGYISQYIYGGYSYFDNMQYFFSNNGYQVIDRDAITKDSVHYANIWGVADEDLFTLALKTLDSNYAQKKPFFSQIMTVSNHRPFTYPAGRIDIDPETHTREGAVKYTDYAINKFIKEASTRPWYNNTLFIVVADHCAGSAGSVELPVTGYHIPMLLFAPAIVQPQRVEQMMSQIDIAPTLLGMLHFNYRSKFMGRDIFNSTKEKAFISTYQGLGYIEDKNLVILSPVKKVRQFEPDFTTGDAVQVPLNDSLAKKATAFYQVASWLIKKKQYQK